MVLGGLFVVCLGWFFCGFLLLKLLHLFVGGCVDWWLVLELRLIGLDLFILWDVCCVVGWFEFVFMGWGWCFVVVVPIGVAVWGFGFVWFGDLGLVVIELIWVWLGLFV